ncbi:collagen-like protein mcl1 [Colletotrichum incanum]|uniref:Collagen-like protein mcl1 n=1 Tax=Colletotrichum incanum TaxID=1573173 RepID=A0A166TJQ5_COLIC|nr:collagen-like protein mcl1 [Colletotrichum incanum]OHW94504.1 collagen-like protein mcl1 [Colletotrichum incanum]
MRQTTFITGLAAMLPSAAEAWSVPALLDSRQNSRPYQEVVCKPEVGSGSQLPPCVQIENIEVTCKPNGTDPIYLEAHAQCMCGGSFFAEKLACERCLFVHGLRSERSLAYYSGVLSSASNALCTGTPTAAFATIYSNIEVAATPITTGATATSDQAPSNTAISLYYTASGPQGPGSITGEAASATGTSNATTANPTTIATGSTMSRDASTRASTTAAATAATAATTGTATGDAATTTSASGNGAVPTYAAGGLMMGAAGLAVFAGL